MVGTDEAKGFPSTSCTSRSKSSASDTGSATEVRARDADRLTGALDHGRGPRRGGDPADRG